MTEERPDSLERALAGLPKLSPGDARSKGIQARCGALYKAAREAPVSPPPRARLVILGVLSVLYLLELTRLAASLSAG